MSASSDTSNEYGGLLFTDTGPTSPTLPEIRSKLAERYREVWGHDLDLATYTPQGQILDSNSAMVFDKNSNVQYIVEQFNPETNEGRYQDAICKIYFISRKPAIPTSVVCRCVGVMSTRIPIGAKVVDKYKREYAAAEEIVIPASGTAYGTFECLTPGPVFVAADAITKVVTKVNGWDTVHNEEAGAVGKLQESRFELEHRRYAGVAKNAHGSVESIWGALSDLTNVISVAVAENDSAQNKTLMGVSVESNAVFISVVGDTDENVAWTIHRKKGGGCGMGGNTEVVLQVPINGGARTYPKLIRFNRPHNTPCYVRVTIREKETPFDIDQRIKDVVLNVWRGQTSQRRADVADNILASTFYCAVNNMSDDFDLISVHVSRSMQSNWVDELDFTLDEYPVAGEETIIVERV